MWQSSGRQDSDKKERLNQWVQEVRVEEIEKKEPASSSPPPLAFLGFACDEGIKRNQGRVGAALGPNSLRQALLNLALQREDLTLYDVGTIACSDQDLEKAQQEFSEIVTTLVYKGVVPIGLGGGHEIAWAHFQGLMKGLQPNLPQNSKGIALINFDAHFDMRPSLMKGGAQKGHSGSSFLQMATYLEEIHTPLPFSYACIGVQREGNTPSLFKKAGEKRVYTLFAEEIHQNRGRTALQMINYLISSHDHIYLSICLDVFAAAYAPGVSAPQPLGLTPWQVIPLLRRLARSKKVRGLDLAELSPPHDPLGITARLGAALLGDWIAHWGL